MKRLLKVLALLAAFGVLAVGALLAALALERRMETTLPAPTGPYAVGRAIYDWTDDATLDKLAPVPGTKRELLVWIWYPAAAAPSAAPDGYIPAPMLAALPPGGGPLRFLTRDLAKVHGHSIRDAEVSPRQRTYPVVIVRAGASAGVVGYSALAEDLASHGYVVAGFDAPYRTGVVVFPDGRVMWRTPENNGELCASRPPAEQDACMSRLLTAWVSDIGFVLDRLEHLSGKFAGRLDMTRVGVFGHSFGGATAAQFCHDDTRCKAAIDIDGQPFGSVIQAGLRQPFLFLLSDHGRASDPVSRRIMANIQSIYDRLPPETRLRVVIRGANHFLFSDDGALLKSHIMMGMLRMLHVIRIEGRRQLAVTAHCVHSFFDAHLQGTRLDMASPLYPEIEVVE
jgi:dienelactone hydrolase